MDQLGAVYHLIHAEKNNNKKNNVVKIGPSLSKLSGSAHALFVIALICVWYWFVDLVLVSFVVLHSSQWAGRPCYV